MLSVDFVLPCTMCEELVLYLPISLGMRSLPLAYRGDYHKGKHGPHVRCHNDYGAGYVRLSDLLVLDSSSHRFSTQIEYQLIGHFSTTNTLPIMTKGSSSSPSGSGSSSSNNSSDGGYTTTSSGTNDQVCHLFLAWSIRTKICVVGQPLLFPRLRLGRLKLKLVSLLQH
jgi:hypothetical protein